MELVGKWKVSEVYYFAPKDGMTWMTADELAKTADVDNELIDMLANSVMVFTEDGFVETLMPFHPEDFTPEEIEQAIANGLEFRDGMAVVEKKPWKKEWERYLYNTEEDRELFGEEVSPWDEIKQVGDMIEFSAMRLMRIE